MVCSAASSVVVTAETAETPVRSQYLTLEIVHVSGRQEY